MLGPVDRHAWGPGPLRDAGCGSASWTGAPLMTFTSPHGACAVEHTTPAPAYLSMMATGLREARGWDDDEISAYLDRPVVRLGSSRDLRVLADRDHLSHCPRRVGTVERSGQLALLGPVGGVRGAGGSLRRGRDGDDGAHRRHRGAGDPRARRAGGALPRPARDGRAADPHRPRRQGLRRGGRGDREHLRDRPGRRGHRPDGDGGRAARPWTPSARWPRAARR